MVFCGLCIAQMCLSSFAPVPGAGCNNRVETVYFSWLVLHAMCSVAFGSSVSCLWECVDACCMVDESMSQSCCMAARAVSMEVEQQMCQGVNNTLHSSSCHTDASCAPHERVSHNKLFSKSPKDQIWCHNPPVINTQVKSQLLDSWIDSWI